MANTKTSALAALTSVADGDLFMAVDVSATPPATGTNKKATAAVLADYIAQALTTVEDVGIALADRGFVVVDTNDPRLPDDVADATFPFKVCYPSGGDDTSAIQADVDAVELAGGGTVTLAPGVYSISARVTVPPTVNFLAAGAGKTNDSQPIVRIVCTAAGAGVSIGARTVTFFGGEHGGFEVDGNDTATNPLYIGQCAGAHFHPMRADNATGFGVVIESAQNCTFDKLQAAECAGGGIKIDSGAGGLVFNMPATAKCGAAGAPALLITETYGDGPYTTTGPSQLTFVGGIFERANTGQDVIARHAAGRNNTFLNCIFNSAEATTGIYLLDIPSQATYQNSIIRLVGCSWTGEGANSTGVRMGSGHGVVSFEGLSWFNNLNRGFEIIGNVQCNLEYVTASSVTTFAFDTGGAASTVLRTRYLYQLESTRGAATDAVLSALVTGDSANRWLQRANGQLEWGPGNAAIDTNLFRNAANQLRTNDEFVADLGVRIGSGASTSPVWKSGTGTPEGVVTASVGSLFSRTDGGAATTLYVKESGAGNTGWVAK